MLFSFSTIIELKSVQPANALYPMLVTELGIIIPVKFVHPINDSFPIEVTEFGIETDSKLLQ